jgi:hypothetical protein
VDFLRIRLFHGKKLKSSFVFIKWIDYKTDTAALVAVAGGSEP